MPSWMRYKWDDFEPSDLPWAFQSERSVMPVPPHPGNRATAAEHDTATGLGFDPLHTFFTVLTREWRGHPAGSRTLIEVTEIAIEALPTINSKRMGEHVHSSPSPEVRTSRPA